MRRFGHAAAAGRQLVMSTRTGGVARGEAIAAGLVVDGVPESIALGLTVAKGEIGLALLAGILVGNTVEAYGAAQPIIAGGRSKRFTLALLAGIGAALGVTTSSAARCCPRRTRRSSAAPKRSPPVPCSL